MYRDTEQTYRGWTIDVYLIESDSSLTGLPRGTWLADFWKPGSHHNGPSFSGKSKKDVVDAAKKFIDSQETTQTGGS